jgi:hypothetical protein
MFWRRSGGEPAKLEVPWATNSLMPSAAGSSPLIAGWSTVTGKVTVRWLLCMPCNIAVAAAT